MTVSPGSERANLLFYLKDNVENHHLKFIPDNEDPVILDRHSIRSLLARQVLGGVFQLKDPITTEINWGQGPEKKKCSFKEICKNFSKLAFTRRWYRNIIQSMVEGSMVH